MQNVAQQARACLRGYLAKFPDEAPRLAQALAQLADANPNILMRSNMLGHITTSIAAVDTASRKILMVAHGIYKDWMPSGGHFEADVSLWLSAFREGLEETGVSVTRIDWCGEGTSELSIDIDTHPIPANESKGEGDHFHHDFTYLGLASEHALIVEQEIEVDGVQWQHVHELRSSPLERVRRIGAKIEAIFGWQ
jgi:8-oxo-dGTP pyrophosphatase MutT (NUDIX family)